MRQIFAVVVAILAATFTIYIVHTLIHIHLGEMKTDRDFILALEGAGVLIMLVFVVEKNLLHSVRNILRDIRGQPEVPGATWQQNFDAVFVTVLFSAVIYYVFLRVIPQ